MKDRKTTTGRVQEDLKSPKTINASRSSQDACTNLQTSSSSNIVSEEILEDDEKEIEMISNLEKEARRKDSKRKQDNQGHGKGKRRKLPRLEDWGEANVEAEDPVMAGWRGEQKTTVVEQEAEEMLEKETETMIKRQRKIPTKNKEIQKRKFKYNTTGKITKKEFSEIKRTHSNVFDWFKKQNEKQIELENFEKRVEVEPMEIPAETVVEKEERLERVLIRKKEFLSKNVTRSMLEDVLGMVAGYRVKEGMMDMLEGVLYTVVEEAAINQMVMELENGRPKMKDKLESRLRGMRLEEMRAIQILIAEDTKMTRLEDRKLKQLAWKKEYRKKQLDIMMKELRSLDLEPDMLVDDDVETVDEMTIDEVLKITLRTE